MVKIKTKVKIGTKDGKNLILADEYNQTTLAELKEHKHRDYADKVHTHREYVGKEHTHKEYVNKYHKHFDLSNKFHNHDKQYLRKTDRDILESKIVTNKYDNHSLLINLDNDDHPQYLTLNRAKEHFVHESHNHDNDYAPRLHVHDYSELDHTHPLVEHTHDFASKEYVDKANKEKVNIIYKYNENPQQIDKNTVIEFPNSIFDIVDMEAGLYEITYNMTLVATYGKEPTAIEIYAKLEDKEIAGSKTIVNCNAHNEGANISLRFPIQIYKNKTRVNIIANKKWGSNVIKTYPNSCSIYIRRII